MSQDNTTANNQNETEQKGFIQQAKEAIINTKDQIVSAFNEKKENVEIKNAQSEFLNRNNNLDALNENTKQNLNSEYVGETTVIPHYDNKKL